MTRTIWISTRSVTCDEKNHTLINTLEIEMTRTTKHVTLRWHCRRKCRCQLTFIFVFENVTWHFGFEVERQIKFVKHTHWFEGRLSPSTAQSRPNLIPLMLFESTYMYKVPICEFGCTTINFVHKCHTTTLITCPWWCTHHWAIYRSTIAGSFKNNSKNKKRKN